MTGYSDLTIWLIVISLGLGTYLLRWSFLGALGQRIMSGWMLKMLRYTPVAILPALIAPLVVWPSATDGEPDPARLSAAFVTVTVGFLTKSLILSILLGASTLYGMLYLLG